MTLRDIEAQWKALATGVTSKFELIQLGYSGYIYSHIVVKRAYSSYILSMHESRRDHRYCPLIPLLGDLEQHLSRTESTGYRRNHKISAHTAGPFWLYSWVVVKRTCSDHISIHDRRRRHRYWLFAWLLGDLDQHWIAAESAGYRRNHEISADTARPFWVYSCVVVNRAWVVTYPCMIDIVAIDI